MQWLGLFAALLFGSSGARADELNTGDTAWVITATVLVLFMTIPGLSLFYAGMVRSKNVLSVMMQCFAITGLMSILWVFFGYSIAFGNDGSWWGGLSKAFLKGVTVDAMTGTIPETVFMTFQMTFAIITPALIVGAFAERMKFSAMLWFMGVWVLVVYAPICHWVWGGGWLGDYGILDFAGGTVVHINAGMAGLAAALVLGKRQGYPDTAMPPNNLGYTLMGAAMLWVGWFGFNGGSALAATDDASSAVINTHVAASAAALVWLLIERIGFGKTTTVGWATGAIAGLATITPAAGFISPGASIFFGALAAVVCYGAVLQIRNWGIDDSLDVFAVHGVGGILGTILLGLFLSSALGGTGYAEGMTPLGQIGAQAIGIAVVALWSAVLTAILALGIGIIAPMRVKKKHEIEGLDITSHGERGWHFGD